MDSVLVTGALGKVGRWTVDELADDHDVVGVDLRRPPDGSTREGVSYLAADLTEQGPTWELLADLRPDAVVHLAAVPGAGRRAGTETFMTNVASTYSVFEADGHVFGYLELENPEVIQDVMTNSEAQAEWNEVMDGILEESDDQWMDEVYRMR